MKATEIVIALDQGSSSSRALAFDPKGRVVARAQFPVATFLPRPGWYEHDATELAGTLERALDTVLGRLPRKARVVGVGIAAQRSTVVLWDTETGRPVCRAPSWQDARAAGLVAPLQQDPRRQAEVREKTGLHLTPFYSAPKIRFLLDQTPKARLMADKGRLAIGPVSSYALWRLTRGEVFRTDPSMGQRMLLYNLRRGCWDAGLLSLFRIPRATLPEIVPTAGEWGVIARKGRRMPVLAVMGDQQSAALGQGGSEPGVGVLNYGTGAFFLLHTGEELHRLPGLLTSVAWQMEDRPCRYFLEGSVHAAGTSFEWLRRNFGILRSVRSVNAACRRSRQRVLALQALGGLGAPRWDYRTPTVFMGLGPQTRSEDVVRGVMESIAFLVADVVTPMLDAGLEIRDFRASGGLAGVDALLQFQADILQRRIIRFKEREATALGVASLAAEQAGAPWAASLRGGVRDRVFSPSLEGRAARRLLEGWRRFVEAQQRLAAELRELGVLE
ncbi:MAG: FGGY family carbohydrate kinase [Elusimicrobiota bacterium]